MKRLIRYFLSRLAIHTGIDLLSSLNLIRGFPEIYRWYKNAFSEFAPALIKRRILTSYLRSRGLKTFVETGTHTGDTLAEVAADQTVQAISIELADHCCMVTAASCCLKWWTNCRRPHYSGLTDITAAVLPPKAL